MVKLTTSLRAARTIINGRCQIKLVAGFSTQKVTSLVMDSSPTSMASMAK